MRNKKGAGSMAGFNVVFNGRLVPGVNRAELVEAFSSRFGYQKTRVVDMLASRKPVVLKRNIDRETAEKFRVILGELGMEVDIETASDGTGMDLALEPVDNKGESPLHRDHSAIFDSQQAAAEFDFKESDAAATAAFNGIAAVDAGRGVYWITQA